MNEDMYLKSSLAATGSDNSSKYVVPNDAGEFDERERGNIAKSSLIAATTFNYKINTRHKIETGLILTRLNFNMNTYEWNAEQNQLVNELSDKGHSSTLQAFTTWKYRISESLTMIGGVHYLQFALNNNNSIEPRFAMKWAMTERQSFNIGVGLHSKLEGVSTYLAKQYADNGTFSRILFCQIG